MKKHVKVYDNVKVVWYMAKLNDDAIQAYVSRKLAEMGITAQHQIRVVAGTRQLNDGTDTKYVQYDVLGPQKNVLAHVFVESK